MANYTITQCLAVAAIPEDKKEWLRQLQASKLPAVNGKTFTAQNQAALVTLVTQEFEKYTAAKARRDAKNAERNQCFQLLKEMVGAKGVPQLITPAELLPKLQALKQSIEIESKVAKVEKAIESTGMTTEQLIEYLRNKQ